MRPISFQTVDSIIITFDARLSIFKKKILTNLNSLIFPQTPKNKKAYINHIITNIDKIITGKPEVINTLKKEFDAIIAPKLMASKAYKDYKDKILVALEYSSRRSDFYPKYFHQLGIKACVYCNSQLTVTIEEKVNLKTKTRIDHTAKFQVDHFLPKADYPCFSISLYNLYPVCANCNIAKSKSIVDFNLYLDEQDFTSNSYKFDLEKGTVAKYLISRNIEDIQYKFSEPMVVKPTKSFQEVFKIQEIYETQKDVAEELILKAEIYTEEYKKNLKKQFPLLFTNEGIFNRLLLGNYSTEEDLHKRPMAKFTMDVAKQVGLIKKK